MNTAGNVIIADRRLTLIDVYTGHASPVTIKIFEPKIAKVYSTDTENVDWVVEFQICGLSGPESIWTGRTFQVDAIGALMQALNSIASYVRSTEHFRDGRLYWLNRDDNCGLPLTVESNYAESED